MADNSVMPSVYISLTRHPIIATVIGGAILGTCSWSWNTYHQMKDKEKTQDQEFYKAVSTLQNDIRNKDLDDFTQRAIEFRRTMQSDGFPRKYSTSFFHPFRSREGAVADLADLTTESISTYLDHCSGKKAIYDQRQLSADCESALDTFVSEALETLHKQLFADEIK